jgi:hypothetical protein
LLLEDATVRDDKGPFKVFSDCISVSIAEVAVCIAFRAVVWLVSVV